MNLKLNSCLSFFPESPRLSAGSSSSNEKFSSSASFSTDFYDSDRPVSLISTASSGSLREGRDLYENIRPDKEVPLGNCPTGLDMELVSGETLHTTFRDMQSALKNSHVTNGNNNVSRRSRGSRSLSPFGTKVSGISNKLSYVERVVLEIIETERMYVQDLRSIAEVCNSPFTLALWEILYFLTEVREHPLRAFLWVEWGNLLPDF